MPALRTAVLALALLPLAALAQTPGVIPEPLCALNPETGRLGAAAEVAGGIPVWPTMHRGGVVAFDWFDGPQRVLGMIQHCATGTTLRWDIRADPEGRLRAELWGMLTSDIEHGFDDLRAAVRYHGGRARLIASPGACGCESPTWFSGS